MPHWELEICTKLGGGEVWAIVGNNFMRHSMGWKCGGLHNPYFWPSGTSIYHGTKTFSTRRAGSTAMADLALALCSGAVMWMLYLELGKQLIYELAVLWRVQFQATKRFLLEDVLSSQCPGGLHGQVSEFVFGEKLVWIYTGSTKDNAINNFQFVSVAIIGTCRIDLRPIIIHDALTDVIGKGPTVQYVLVV